MIVAIDLGRYAFDASLLEQVQVQYSANGAVASSSGALYAVVRDGAGTGFVVLRLNPTTGSARVLTTVAADVPVGQWQVAAAASSLQILLPDESELVRVAPSFGGHAERTPSHYGRLKLISALIMHGSTSQICLQQCSENCRSDLG